MPSLTDNPTLPGGLPGTLAETANSRIDRLSDSAHKTINRVADKAAAATHRFRAKRAQLSSLQHELTDKSCQTVCRHPVASLAIALVAGLLISHLADRRSDVEPH